MQQRRTQLRKMQQKNMQQRNMQQRNKQQRNMQKRSMQQRNMQKVQLFQLFWNLSLEGSPYRYQHLYVLDEYFEVRYDGGRAAHEILCVETGCRLCLSSHPQSTDFQYL